MALHILAQGGDRVNNTSSYVRSMFPSVPPLPDAPFAPDARRTDVRHAITRCFDLSCGSLDCGCNTAQCRGSRALRQYIEANPIANGDSIALVFIPKETTLDRIFWKVSSSIATGTFDIRFVPTVPSGPVPPAVVLATGVPMTAVGMDVIDVWDVNGGPLLAEYNGHVEIVVNGLPPVTPTTPCGCAGAGGLYGLNLTFNATVERYQTGCY